MKILYSLLLFFSPPIAAQEYLLSAETPPRLASEFRAAWVATVYNIDWPSAPGLPIEEQKSQARAILDRLAALKMNAVILQVRPHADAFYASDLEPWSHWLTGKMGKSPGYDPLAYWIAEAHSRDLELHAWFNPFRALSNRKHPASSSHISRSKPHLTKPYGNMLWCDPSIPEVRAHTLAVIADVTRRYDIDGIHLDDYFYPYPSGKLIFADSRTPEQRRAVINEFVKNLYFSVKAIKPHARVGISPFGIYRPGIPAGIEAGIDSYEDLAGDSLKWLTNGWVDYLAPQLYWRIRPRKQSFTALLTWWRAQGTRPVWPGIASSRIESKDDPGRPASEILEQIVLTRSIGRNWVGHIHWSVSALMDNQGGISTQLPRAYTEPVSTPPMPWLNIVPPALPNISVAANGELTSIRIPSLQEGSSIVIQTRDGNTWKTSQVKFLTTKAPAEITIPKAEAVALTILSQFNTASPTLVLREASN